MTNTPNTNASPIPTGKATDRPQIAIAADNRILAALKIMPPRKALPNDLISACAKLSRNPCPSEPKLPNVKAEKTEKSNTPIT